MLLAAHRVFVYTGRLAALTIDGSLHVTSPGLFLSSQPSSSAAAAAAYTVAARATECKFRRGTLAKAE